MSKFGWCLPGDDNHDRCIKQFDWHGTLMSCECDCHKEETK